MAFNDPPYIDSCAERSEKSVIKTRFYFCKENGFISREVTNDDYGVDIYSEIIIEGGATGSIFPIQIKSTKKSKYIFNKKKYYTLSFSTSRLGYLYRNTSFFAGLIIYYDEASDKLYFDYVTEILDRLILGKKDDSWRKQDKVQISFPEENLVDNESIKIIHQTIKKRFELVRNELYNGIDFDFIHLKSRKIENQENKVLKIVATLKQSGSYLFNQRKYSFLIHLLEQLPKKIIDSPRIAYFAALVYTECSIVLSADYFHKICLQNYSNYSEEDREALMMQKFKNDFQLGLYSYDELLGQLDDLKFKVKSPENLLSIEININQIEINKVFEAKNLDNKLEEKTYVFYSKILNFDIDDEQKYFQLIFQTENLLHTIIGKFSIYLVKRKLYKDSRIEFALKNELEFEKFNNTFNEINNNLKKAYDYATENNNELMLAHFYYQSALGSFIVNLNYYIFDYEFQVIEKLKNILGKIYSDFIRAFNLYKKFDLNHQIFLSVSNALETCQLAKHWINYNLVDEETRSKLNDDIKSFSNEVYFNRYSSIVSKIANDKIQNVKIELDDKQIELMAKMAIEMEQFPEDRIENIKNEIRSINLFRKVCKNNDLEFLSNQANPNLGSDRYKNPSKYAIISRTSGIIYSEGYDIKEMLRKLGYG
jgi:hypothetical protein